MLFTIIASGQQVEKTLVKAFNLQGKQELVLDLDGIVEVSQWENDIMRIQMQISVQTSSTMLKSMVRSGRYRLLSKEEGDKFIVYAPGTASKGLNKNLNERIVYKIYVPENVEVQVMDEILSTSGNASKTGSLRQ
ncbi:MAG: hypothetical protein AAFO94_08980 [Bacteroidota bacterium]